MLGQFLKNSAWNSMGTICNMVLNILFAGFTIRYLGEARAGYFIALYAVLGINSLLGAQIFRGPSIQRMAAASAEGRWKDCRQIVGAVVVTNSMVGGILAAALIISTPLLFRLSKLDNAYSSEAAWATLFIACNFLCDQVSGAFRMVYDARQRFDITARLTVGFSLLGNLLKLGVLKVCPSMAAVSLAGLAIAFLWLSVDFCLVRKLLCGWVRPRWSWSTLRPMLGFGAWNWYDNLAGFLFGNLDRIILTTFLGSASLPYYAYPLRMAEQIYTAVATQVYVLFPSLAGVGTRVYAEIQRVEDRLRWVVSFISAFAYVGIVLVGPTIMAFLVSPQFAEKARWPLYLSCLVYFAWAQSLVYFFSLHAVGKPHPNVLTSMGCNLSSIGTAMLLIPRFGYVGASAALLWRLPFVCAQLIWARRVLLINTGILKGLTSYISVAAAALLWLAIGLTITKQIPIESMWRIAISGLLGLPAVMLVWQIETRFFPDSMRWNSLLKAVTLVRTKVSAVLQRA